MLVVVDDNPGDILLFRRALARWGGCLEVAFASSNATVIELLERDDQREIRLVVVDLKLAGVDGWVTLERIAEDRTRGIDRGTVVLSSSKRDDDKKRAKALGVLQFMTKPLAFDGYREVVQAIVGIHG